MIEKVDHVHYDVLYLCQWLDVVIVIGTFDNSLSSFCHWLINFVWESKLCQVIHWTISFFLCHHILLRFNYLNLDVLLL